MERAEYLKGHLESKRRLITRLTEEINKLLQHINEQKSIIDNLDDYCIKKVTCVEKKKHFETLLGFESNRSRSQDTISNSPSCNLITMEQQMTTENVVNSIQTKEYDMFFLQNPFILSALIDGNTANLNYQNIFTSVEKMNIEDRENFIKTYMQCLNSISTFVQVFNNIAEASSMEELCFKIETDIPSALSLARAVFLSIDEEGVLFLEKQQLKFYFRCNEGCVADVINDGIPRVCYADSAHLASSDKELLRRNVSMLVAAVGKPARGVIILFDKTGGFQEADFVLSRLLASYVEAALPLVGLRAGREAALDGSQSSLDVFLELAGRPDARDIIGAAPPLLCAEFRCEAARIFVVGDDGRLRTAAGQRLPARAGLVGDAVARRRPVRLSRPELSPLFSVPADREAVEAPARSLLACPVGSPPAYAVALYNKRESAGFDGADEARLEMICGALAPVLAAAFKTHKLSEASEAAKSETGSYDAVLNFVSALASRGGGLSRCLSEELGRGMPEWTPALLAVDRGAGTVGAAGGPDGERLSGDSFAARVVRSGAPADEVDPSGSTAASFFPVRGAGGVNGVIVLRRAMGVSGSHELTNSRISFGPSLESLSRLAVDSKIERLNAVASHDLLPVHDRSVADAVGHWVPLVGALLEAEETSRRVSRRAAVADGLARHRSGPLRALFARAAPRGAALFAPLPVASASFERAESELVASLEKFIGFSAEPQQPPQQDSLATTQLSLAFDARAMRPGQLLAEAASLIASAGAEEEYGCTRASIFELVLGLRSTHTPSSWERAVDSAQLACVLVSQLGGLGIGTNDAVGLILFFLSSGADPAGGISPSERARRAAEGLRPQAADSIVAALCLCVEHMFLFAGAAQEEVLTAVRSLSSAGEFDGCCGAFLPMIASIARFSFLARSAEVARAAFAVDGEDEEKTRMREAQLEFDVRTIVIPCFGECIKRGVRIDSIRSVMTANASAITGASF